MDQQLTEKESAQGHPSRPTGNKPQGSAPTAPTTQAEGPSQAPPVTKPSTSHQDPLECNDTNGSTKAPTNSKGPGATKAKKALTNAGPATQSSDSSKNTIICSQCGKSGHWSRNCPYDNFCDFCRGDHTLNSHVVEPTNVDLDHQSVFTAANLITVLLLVGMGPRTTRKSLDRHQMLKKLVLLVKIQHQHPEIKLDPPIITLIIILFHI